jgi:hypothetical protein
MPQLQDKQQKNWPLAGAGAYAPSQPAMQNTNPPAAKYKDKPKP